MRLTVEQAEEFLQSRFGEMMNRESTGGNCTAFTNQDSTIIVTFEDNCDVNEIDFDHDSNTWIIETDGFWTLGFYDAPAFEDGEASMMFELAWNEINVAEKVIAMNKVSVV